MAIRNTRRRNFRNIAHSKPQAFSNSIPWSKWGLVTHINNKQSWGEVRDYTIRQSDSNINLSKKRSISTVKDSNIHVEYFSDGTKRMRWIDNRNNSNKSNTLFPIQTRIKNRR